EGLQQRQPLLAKAAADLHQLLLLNLGLLDHLSHFAQLGAGGLQTEQQAEGPVWLRHLLLDRLQIERLQQGQGNRASVGGGHQVGVGGPGLDELAQAPVRRLGRAEGRGGRGTALQSDPGSIEQDRQT
ncbi:MAG: hypothetical protein ACK56I_36150, partial [bacterium]